MRDKDRFILERIVEYCAQIDQTVERFGDSLDAFKDDTIYRNACCMCILQIGELAGKLSEDAQALNPAIPWRAIKDMRNLFAHAYGKIDIMLTWETIKGDIPSFRRECERMLAAG